MGRTAAWALWVACFAAAAQTDDSVELGTLQVTASRVPESQYGVPQPVTVVSRDDIERAAPQMWTELLRGQPGAFTQSSGPGQGIVILRGLKGSEVLHLVDGFRLNNTFFRSAPSQYVTLVDPQNIEQVELLRGPYAALYGSDAMGGVVQLLTPEPEFTGRQWDFGATARARLGSADLSKITRIEGATGREGLSFSGGFSYMDVGARKLATEGQSAIAPGVIVADDRVQPTAYLARGYDAKTLWRPASRHELMFSAQYFEIPLLTRYHEVVPGFDTDGAPGPDADIAELMPNDRLFLHARYRWQSPFAFAERVELHLGQQVINDDRLSRDFGDSVDRREENRSTLTGFTAQALADLGASASLLYGLELYTDRVDSSRMDTDSGTGSSSPERARFPDGGRSDSFGLYASLEWLPDDAWLVDAGVRLSHAAARFPANPPPTGTGIGVDIADRDVSGNVGIQRKLTPDVSWVINAGRGFRAPNLFDLGTFGNRPGNRFNIPNADLRPEAVTSADTGLKWDAAGLQGEVSVFYSRYSDRITSVDTGDSCAATPGCSNDRTVVQSRNIARAQYWGVESGARWALRSGFVLYGGLNYTHGTEEESPGVITPANRVPPLNGQAGVRWRLPQAVELETYVSFADRQDRLDNDDLRDNRINPDGTGGWGTWNLRGVWRPLLNTRLQLDLTNILDKAYREHGSGIDAPGFGAALTLEQKL